jgi:hypothetical protein
MVIEAEFLAAKCRGAAKNTIFLEMVAGGVGHGVPPKFGLSAVSHQLSANGEQLVSAGCRYADSKGIECVRGLRPDKL